MPNLRQKQVLKMVGNGWNLSKAMRRAGYSESYIRNNQKLKKSSGWEKLMDKYFSDEKLFQVHRKLLNAKRKVRIGSKTTKEDDFRTIARGLDMIYKMKGYYKPEMILSTLNEQDKYIRELSDEELDKLLEEEYLKIKSRKF